MAVEDILKRISSDAEKAAQEILAETRREADAILAQSREKSGLELERMRAKARQRATEERNRIVTLAKLGARRDLLQEKQALIDRVFEDVRTSVATMGADEYRRLMKVFLVRTVEAGDEEVIVDEGERRIDQGFLDQVSKELGKPGRLTLSSESRRIGGGFVLRRGKTETNCALDTILRDARDRLETEVAGILFPREGGR
jgi:V/A-type H+-transporting ATPase subunit E